MSKTYARKSTLILTLAAAMAASGSLVFADEATTTTPNPSSTQESPQAAVNSTVASNEPTHILSTEANNPSDTAPREGEVVDLRILATTDLHTNLVNYDYYQDKPVETLGLAKTAVLIEEAKQENPNVVIVDNGDTIQGTPLGTYKSIIDPVEKGEQHPMYAALQALGFDAGTLGNHEFNYGLDYLNKVIESANMPIVNANVIDPKTGNFVYNPYQILTKTVKDTNGRDVSLNIGVTGIVPPQILNWDKANLEGKVDVMDSVEAVKAIVPVMRKAGADIILVLSHSGIGDDVYEKGEENVGYQIASLAGVDAVVTGHSHAEFPSGTGMGFYEKYKGVDGVEGKINGVPVTMGGKYGDHLGIIDLNLTYTDGAWTVSKSKASIRKIDTKSNKADQRIVAIAKEAHEGTVQYVRQQVGTTTAPITSYFALVKDDPSIQIVNNAQLWYAKQELAGTPEGELPLLSAAAPFKAGTRGDASAYTDIPAGPIAIKNVADLYLYDNVTAIIKVTGAQLKEWLEMAAGQFNQIDPTKKEAQNLVNTDFRTYNFDVIDGVTYQFDVTQPNKYDRNGKLVNETASRVRNLQYQGKEVTDTQEFIVVSNNYRANGTFPGIKDASLKRLLNLENRQAIINYILAEKNINPSADNNWGFTDSIKDLDIRFLTADRAKELIADSKEISYLGASATSEGFGEYKFTYVEPKKEEEKPTEDTEQQKPEQHKPADKGQTIVLPDSKQTVTFPDKVDHKDPQTPTQTPLQDPKTPLNQQKYTETTPDTNQSPTNLSHTILAKKQETQTVVKGQQELPATGQTSSPMSLVGLALAGWTSLFLAKKKEQEK